jgi:multiple sugar transport system substrate-binding protein
MRSRAVVLASALLMAPLGARAADLVVWWDKGYSPQADQAVAEILAAFEQKTGKQVELVQPRQDEVFGKLQAALAAGRPPDFLFGTFATQWAPQSAYADQLVDLESAIGTARDLFDADLIDLSTMLDGKTGRRGLYALPMGRYSNYVFVWTSLLERAGFTLADIPKQWDAFWSFWCDRVQPAVRRVTGRNDIWGSDCRCRLRLTTPRSSSSSSSSGMARLGLALIAAFRSTIPAYARASSKPWMPIP